MAVHIGKLIKRAVEMRGMKITELARRINTSRENVYGIFKRESIDTALLQKLSSVLDVNFFEPYLMPPDNKTAVKEVLVTYNAISPSNNVGNKYADKLSLQKEIASLKKELELKNKIIALLEEKVNKSV